MKLLLNKVAVVTGSSRGLGLEIARLYGLEGALVVISARSADGVERAVQELRAQGIQAVGQPCDVAEQAQVQALRDLALREYGRLDIWVNNAGMSGVYGPTHDLNPQAFERVTRTNIFGTYYGSMAALDVMLPVRQGHLINLLGRGDKSAVPFQTAYASSKSWVRAFTRALAAEYKDSGVHIHGLNPGLVQTDMLGQVDVIRGFEKKVQPLRVISAMWGQTPEVAARPALQLVLSDQTEFQDLRPPQMLSRAARFGWRKLRGQAELPELHITSHEPREGTE